MATAVCNSANRTAPAKLLGHAEPKVYWDPTSSRSHRPAISKPQTMSDKLVAATEEGADKAENTGTRRSAILARAKSCPPFGANQRPNQA